MHLDLHVVVVFSGDMDRKVSEYDLLKAEMDSTLADLNDL